MVALLACWILQDLMQVVLTTAFLVPELFFLMLNARALKFEDEGWYHYLIPFLGGLFLDLRWSSTPGLCAALYVAGHWAFRSFWFRMLPRDGRSFFSFMVINQLLCLLIGAVRVLFWRRDGSLGHLIWLLVFQLILTQPPLWLLATFRSYHDDPIDF